MGLFSIICQKRMIERLSYFSIITLKCNFMSDGCIHLEASAAFHDGEDTNHGTCFMLRAIASHYRRRKWVEVLISHLLYWVQLSFILLNCGLLVIIVGIDGINNFQVYYHCEVVDEIANGKGHDEATCILWWTLYIYIYILLFNC